MDLRIAAHSGDSCVKVEGPCRNTTDPRDSAMRLKADRSEELVLRIFFFLEKK